MRVVEGLEAWGHPNISARNRTTFEFTKENHLTPRGDCIVGIRANKGARDLALEFKTVAKDPSAVIMVEMVVDAMRVVVVGAPPRGRRPCSEQKRKIIRVRRIIAA